MPGARDKGQRVILAAKVVLKRPGAAITTKEIVINKRLLRFQETRYVLLVKVESYIPAQILGSKVVPGRLNGNAVLYELDGTRYLGGFSFSAKVKRTGSIRGFDNKSKIRDILSYYFGEELKSGISRTFPGAKLQKITGYASY